MARFQDLQTTALLLRRLQAAGLLQQPRTISTTVPAATLPLPAPTAVTATLPAPTAVTATLPAPTAVTATLPAPTAVTATLPAPTAVTATLPAPTAVTATPPAVSAIKESESKSNTRDEPVNVLRDIPIKIFHPEKKRDSKTYMLRLQIDEIRNLNLLREEILEQLGKSS